MFVFVIINGSTYVGKGRLRNGIILVMVLQSDYLDHVQVVETNGQSQTTHDAERERGGAIH